MMRVRQTKPVLRFQFLPEIGKTSLTEEEFYNPSSQYQESRQENGNLPSEYVPEKNLRCSCIETTTSKYLKDEQPMWKVL